MTDIELLPLHVRNYVDGDGLWETATGPYSAEETQAYARAVAEHNVAARDAEIEALRAEVDFRDSVIATHAADTREYQKRISQAEARAERLAEALRGMLDEYEALHAKYDLGDCQATVDARAALRDHDQEGKDG